MLSYKMTYEAARDQQRATRERMEEIRREAGEAATAAGQWEWPARYWEQYLAAERKWEEACHATERARRALKARAGTF